jgi:hypothetical protein
MMVPWAEEKDSRLEGCSMMLYNTLIDGICVLGFMERSMVSSLALQEHGNRRNARIFHYDIRSP